MLQRADRFLKDPRDLVKARHREGQVGGCRSAEATDCVVYEATTSFDPIVFLVIPIAFLAAAMLASYLPARRAARVDPNVALRHL